MCMERLYELARLYDLYGGLLREKQRECLRLHIAEDFSLAEIGEELGITRQAAHDNIRRAERALFEMEEALGLRARQEAQERVLTAICAELNALEEPITRAQVRAIAEKIEPYTDIDGKEAGE